jgi:hypothetical protein
LETLYFCKWKQYIQTYIYIYVYTYVYIYMKLLYKCHKWKKHTKKEKTDAEQRERALKTYRSFFLLCNCKMVFVSEFQSTYSHEQTSLVLLCDNKCYFIFGSILLSFKVLIFSSKGIILATYSSTSLPPSQVMFSIYLVPIKI